MELTTFAAGCFWCTEAIFKRINGVMSVISGYSGGKRKDPSYEQVSTGATEHAEAIQIAFDPAVISYEKLLEIFFATHNPTTLNQQGADIGTQYRSVIFYYSDEQKNKALHKIQELEQSHTYNTPIVTEVVPYSEFFTAEEYHQNYYDENPQKSYCQIVINPKIQKLLKEYSSDVKETYK